MKKVFYESWIARHLLLPGYSTITLFAWIFTKYSEKDAQQSMINHECVHIRQWAELTLVSMILICAGLPIFNYSIWWYMLAPLVFYVWYILEWFVRIMIACVIADCREDYDAYSMLSFEKEARLAESNNHYLEDCNYFAWVKMI